MYFRLSLDRRNLNKLKKKYIYFEVTLVGVGGVALCVGPNTISISRIDNMHSTYFTRSTVFLYKFLNSRTQTFQDVCTFGRVDNDGVKAPIWVVLRVIVHGLAQCTLSDTNTHTFRTHNFRWSFLSSCSRKTSYITWHTNSTKRRWGSIRHYQLFSQS